jgi:hypothetical protein|tara:strand:+ start:413 stop:694 length:282 start_codon:yes stop_codon:yes gene_type:complete
MPFANPEDKKAWQKQYNIDNKATLSTYKKEWRQKKTLKKQEEVKQFEDDNATMIEEMEQEEQDKIPKEVKNDIINAEIAELELKIKNLKLKLT